MYRGHTIVAVKMGTQACGTSFQRNKDPALFNASVHHLQQSYSMLAIPVGRNRGSPIS
jgi:hypothetical protein